MPITGMDTSHENTGPETWVPQAIAEQEEYIRRIHSCMEQTGRAHTWATVWSDEPELAAGRWQACATCGVTKTTEDYEAKLSSLPPVG